MMNIISFVYYLDPNDKKHKRVALVSVDHATETAIILLDKKFQKVPLSELTFASWE